MLHSLGGRSSADIARVIPGFPPGLTPARAAWARTAIGPNRAQDLRDGSALPGPSTHLSKQALHSAWFNRTWLYRAARASIREVLQQPALLQWRRFQNAVWMMLCATEHIWLVEWLTVYVGCSPKTPAASGATVPRFQYWLSSYGYARKVCASQPGLEAPADPVEWKTAWPIRTSH